MPKFIVRAKRELLAVLKLLVITHHSRELRSRGQSSVYVILVIIVIIFAVMLSGGTGSLFIANIT